MKSDQAPSSAPHASVRAEQLRHVVARAQELVGSGLVTRDISSWNYQATQVGDVSALALARCLLR